MFLLLHLAPEKPVIIESGILIEHENNKIRNCMWQSEWNICGVEVVILLIDVEKAISDWNWGDAKESRA